MTIDVPFVLFAAARAISYAAAFLIIGATVFRFAVTRTLEGTDGLQGADSFVDDVRSSAGRLAVGAAAVLLLACGVRIYFQARSLLDPSDPVTGEFIGTVIGKSTWGLGWLTQVAAAGLATSAFLLTIIVPRAGWWAAILGTTAVALAAPLTGHGVSAAAGRFGFLLDAIHVLGGGAWLGTLAVVLVAGFQTVRSLAPDRQADAVAILVRTFSPVGLVGAGTAVLAGVIMAYRYVGSFGALISSGYGRTLLLKAAVLAGVAGLGAYNWRVVLPRLGSPASAKEVARNARIELALGVVLLAVTAVMVALPMPGEEH